MKLRPRDMKCFNEVAKVIGKKTAKKELQKVIDSLTQAAYIDLRDNSLAGAFDWASTTTLGQGYNFWSFIDSGVCVKSEDRDIERQVIRLKGRIEAEEAGVVFIKSKLDYKNSEVNGGYP